MNLQYLVHVGYPKAGSTWLQSAIFNGSDSVFSPLDQFGEESNFRYRKSGGDLFYNQNPIGETKIEVNPVQPGFFNAKQARASLEARTNPSAHVSVLSNETWIGHPHSGGATSPEFAKRIKDTLPSAKVLIVVRNQLDMVISAYAHYLCRNDGLASLERFCELSHQTQIPSPNPLYFCYHGIISMYDEMFGQDNVLVLPFEILTRHGANAFTKPIYEFMGYSPPDNIERLESARNARDYTEYAVLRRLRCLNFLGTPTAANSGIALGFGGLRSGAVRAGQRLFSNRRAEALKDKDRAFVERTMGPYFAWSNRILQRRVEADLAALGYILE
jgi:hypothetical protein